MAFTKTYNVTQPSAGTNVHTSRGPAQTESMSVSRRADFFFRNVQVHTPGSGNLMAGTPKVAKKERKKRS
jgi:hypothetical protein